MPNYWSYRVLTFRKAPVLAEDVVRSAWELGVKADDVTAWWQSILFADTPLHEETESARGMTR